MCMGGWGGGGGGGGELAPLSPFLEIDDQIDCLVEGGERGRGDLESWLTCPFPSPCSFFTRFTA